MNVLMVASSYPKFPGDTTAPFIESIARAVAARGHAVDVLLPHHPDLRRPPGEPVRVVEYHYAPREDWSLWGYAQSLQSDVRVRRGVLSPGPARRSRPAPGAGVDARRAPLRRRARPLGRAQRGHGHGHRGRPPASPSW